MGHVKENKETESLKICLKYHVNLNIINGFDQLTNQEIWPTQKYKNKSLNGIST